MSIQNLVVKALLGAMRLTRLNKAVDDVLPVRRNFDEACGRLQPPSQVKLKPAEIRGLRAEWCIPPDADTQRVVMFVHGGGFCIGSITSHRALAAKLALETRIPVLLFEYRLAPEHPYPAAIDDTISIYRWLLDNDFDAHQIIVAGDSAGGGLLLSAMAYLRDNATPLPACLVCFCPWTDMTGSGDSVLQRAHRDPFIDPPSVYAWSKLYAGDRDLKNPYLSALFADFHGFPPTLIQVGTEEVLHDDAARTAARMQADGVAVQFEVWDDMVHVWQMFWQHLPEAQQALTKAAAFIIRNTKNVRRERVQPFSA